MCPLTADCTCEVSIMGIMGTMNWKTLDLIGDAGHYRVRF